MEVSDVAPGGQAVPKSSTMLALSPFQVLNICSSDCWRWQGFPMISTMQEINSQSVAQMSKPFLVFLSIRQLLKAFFLHPLPTKSFTLKLDYKGVLGKDWKSTTCCTRNIKKPRGMKRNSWNQELWCERTHETTAILRLELWEVPANLAQHLRASLQLCWQSFGHVFNNVTVEVREQQCEERGGASDVYCFFFLGKFVATGNTWKYQKHPKAGSLSIP